MDPADSEFLEAVSPSAFINTGHGPVPPGWRRCIHPNEDVYYYNADLRLVTPDDICLPDRLQYVLEAREDHLDCLQGDPNFSYLPSDWEMTVSDASETTSVLGLYSRMAGASFQWTEERGLRVAPKVRFWGFVAEYPSHHPQISPNTEVEFVQALEQAQASIASGSFCPFSAQQIDRLRSIYRRLKARQAQGMDVTANIGWLIGAVMPLEAHDRSLDDRDLESLVSLAGKI